MAMDPVHAVLANPDLLNMIFPANVDSDNEHEELFRLALVCRKFSAVALDILWNTIHDMEQIYCLFPTDIVSTSPLGAMSFSRTPVTRDQWSSFENYAWRIRTIHVAFLEGPDLYEALGRHPTRRHPFPRLTRLQWYGNRSSVSYATIVLCSTLADISFHLFGNGPDHAMADTIQAVRETCTHLRKFEYSLEDGNTPTSTAFETSLNFLIRSSIYLRKVSVPINCRVLDALALLPSLDQLFFTQPAQSDENVLNVTYPVASQSPDQETFVALERIDIWSTFTSICSMHVFLEPFRKMASKPRVELNIRFNSPFPGSFAELPRNLYNALPPNLRIGLVVLCIHQNWGLGVTPPVHSWRSFSWLLESPHLRRLRLDNYSLEIDDNAFAQASRKWTELEILRLCSPSRSIGPHVTFRGLAHLSLLPKLQDLCLTVGPNCTITPSLLYSEQVSTSPLRRLDLRGGFPDADTLQVALFLAKYFPNLQTLETDPEPEPQWPEVRWRMSFLRNVLPEILDGHAWLTSG